MVPNPAEVSVRPPAAILVKVDIGPPRPGFPHHPDPMHVEAEAVVVPGPTSVYLGMGGVVRARDPRQIMRGRVMKTPLPAPEPPGDEA
jgi:hypothetical protein